MNSSTNGLYSPEGKYLWDPWFIWRGDELHLFYLQADRSLAPEERHHHTSIGHAVSTDMVSWQEQPVALTVGSENSWDGQALWTGSVFENQGQYYLFYTGRSKSEYWVQRIGVATSTDLIHWEKVGGQCLSEVVDEYYEHATELDELGTPPAWRDPFIFPWNNEFYMLVTAADKAKEPPFNGCIGLLKSADLQSWQALPPLLSPGLYAELEVPELVERDGRYYLFFSTKADNYNPIWREEIGGGTGLHCYVSDEGPFCGYKALAYSGIVPFSGLPVYNMRTVKQTAGGYIGIGWIDNLGDGEFIGKLSRPREMMITQDGVKISS